MDVSRTRWTLLDDARRGDPAAMRAFVEKYRPAVVRYVAGRGLPGEAEDLAQEVFISLLQPGVLARLSPDRGRFRGYLLRVIRNTIAHHHERRLAGKRGGALPRVTLEQEPADPTSDDPDFDREWMANLLRLALARLEQANPHHHRLLYALFIEGRPASEVAAELGRGPRELKDTIYRARKRLVAIIQEEVSQYTLSRADYSAEVKHLARLLPT